MTIKKAKKAEEKQRNGDNNSWQEICSGPLQTR